MKLLASNANEILITHYMSEASNPTKFGHTCASEGASLYANIDLSWPAKLRQILYKNM